MTIVEPVAVITEEERASYMQWGPAVAGALAAAAIAFVLHTFAAAIGLAVSSSSPTWRDSSLMLQLLSGLYLVLAAIVAFGVGGYIAGRMRSPVVGTDDEIEFRDGSLGIVAWAIAVVLTVLLTSAAASSLTRMTASSGDAVQSVAGENLIAFDLDRLFRADRRPAEHRYRVCTLGSGPHSVDDRRAYRHHAGRSRLPYPPDCGQHRPATARGGAAS